MATTAAQDEYNALFASKPRHLVHPSDSPVDNSDAASFLDDDSDDDRTQRANRRNSKHGAASLASTASKARYTVPTQRHQSNTGPKGVITDAQAYRAAARSHARTSEGMSRASFQRSRERQIASTQPYVPSGLGANGDGRPGSDGEGQEDDDDEEVDDGFMDEWRQNRLKELQGVGGKRVGSSGRGGGVSGRSRFGGLVPVDGAGYLEAVDGSGKDTVVIVYIYDDQSEVSDLIEECVSSLARKYVNTRFVKMHFQEAEMEPAGVPAVLAYRGGDKFAGLVPVFNEIPDDADVNAETLERLFQRHQIL